MAEIRELVEAVHASPIRAVIAVAGAGSQALYPIPGVSLLWRFRDFLQDGIQSGVACLSEVDEVERFQIRIDTMGKRQFRDSGTDNRTIQVPPGYLVEIAALLIEKQQNKFVSQIHESRSYLSAKGCGATVEKPGEFVRPGKAESLKMGRG